MRRLIPAILTIIALCISTISCEKAPLLEVSSPSSINIGNKGGSQTISFTANRDWTVSASESWTRVSPASGTASDAPVSVTITFDPNTSYDARSCTITIRADQLSQTITVTQDTGLGLIVSPTTFNLSSAAQDIETEVQKNVDYTVIISDKGKSFIKYNGTKALSSEKVSFSIAANETYDDREGVITFQQTGGDMTQTVTVKQGQAYGLFITTPEYDLSNSSHTLSVEVRANVEYSVTPKVDWIHYTETKALESKILTLTVDANETYDAREGSVEIKQNGGDLGGTITIRQAENYGLFVSSEGTTISKAEQDVEVEIQYNVDFEVVIPDDAKKMIKYMRYEGDGSDTKSLSTRKYIFTIYENTTYDDRVAPITFKQRDGSLSGTFTITQTQTDAILVEKTDYEFNWEDHDLDIPLKTNVDVEVLFPEEYYWIEKRQEAETKALEEKTIKLHVSFNPTYDTRKGEVIIKQVDADLKQTISVTQTARTWLDADPIQAKPAGGEYKAAVRYNVPYTLDMESLPSWAHYVKTNKVSKNLDELVFQIDEHTGYADRVKEYKLKTEDGSEVIEREIRQEKVIAVFYDDTEIVLDYTAQTYEFKVKTNVDIDYRVFSYDWIFDSSTRVGGKDGDLDIVICPIRVTKNEGARRESKVFIYWKEGNENKSASVPIRQNSLDFIVQTPGTLSTLLDIDNIGQYKMLKVSGSINGDDIITIKRCVNLETLDLEDATIVSGGAAYDGTHYTVDSSISNSMFSGTYIQSFILPKNLKTIGSNAFYDSSVSSITMFEGLETIGSSAFYRCRSLNKLYIPDSVTSIGMSAFSNCYNINDIHFPSNLTSIENSAFRFIDGISKVEIPEHVSRIANLAFDGCDGITEVYLWALPSTLTSLGTSLFANHIYQNATLHIKKGLSKSDYWETELANFANIVADLD